MDARRKRAKTEHAIRDEAVMMVLGDRPHGLTVDELHAELKAADVSISRRTVAYTLDRLHRRGEVRPEPRPDDRRGGRRGPAPVVWFAAGLSVREISEAIDTPSRPAAPSGPPSTAPRRETPLTPAERRILAELVDQGTRKQLEARHGRNWKAKLERTERELSVHVGGNE